MAPQFKQESIVEGSNFTRAPPPMYQCGIAKEEDGQYTVIGSALRCSEGLLVPQHCLADNDLWLVNKVKKWKIEPHVLAEAVPVTEEIMLLQISNDIFATMGMRVAKFSPVPETGVYATITAMDGTHSSGVLKPHPTLLGLAEYAGSTVSGFSGSAYQGTGGAVYGIHLHGGRSNGGQQILYVHSLTKHALRIKEESSEDFLRTQFEKGVEFDIKHVDDEYVLMYNRKTGKYHIGGNTTYEDYENVRQRREKFSQQIDPNSWADQMELDDYDQILNQLEQESGSLNYQMGPAQVPIKQVSSNQQKAGSSSNQTPRPDSVTLCRHLMKKCRQLSENVSATPQNSPKRRVTNTPPKTQEQPH